MKTTLKASFMSLLLLASFAFNGAVFADDQGSCYGDQPCDTPTEWSSSWDDNVCWDDNAWACWDYDECCDKNFRVYLGGLYYNRRFHLDNKNNSINIFDLDPRQSRSLSGNFGGVNVGVEYDPLCFVYGRVDFWWAAGNQTGRCVKSNINEYWTEGRVGWTWGECSPCGWRLTPYSGIGWFWIDRHFHNYFTKDNGNIDTRFDRFKISYTTWYVPVGIRGEVELMPDFTAGLDVAWMPQFGSSYKFGKDKSIELNNGDFSNRYAWRVEVPLRYLVPCNWDIEVAVIPFWQQINCGGNKHTLINPNRSSRRADNVRFAIPKFREDYWGAKFLVGVRF